MLKIFEWRPTRSAGTARLKNFMPRTGKAYAQARNFIFAPEDRSNISCSRRSNAYSAETFVVEQNPSRKFSSALTARDGLSNVCSSYRRELQCSVDFLEANPSLANRYAEAIETRTGIDCFDTWARELVTNGDLHNHSPMWFASMWIFVLQLPWQLGADFFYRHLLSGDSASNTLSWRSVGGLHIKGKTYLARSSNIARFNNGRFNSAGQLAAVAPALEEDGVGASIPLSPADPFPQEQQYGLLITEEDYHPESLALTATGQRSPLAASECASAFARGAFQDAMQRVEANFEVQRSEASPTEAEGW